MKGSSRPGRIAMHHLIDGYNLLHALGRLTPRSSRDALEGARKWLFGQLRSVARPPTRVTVVFDAQNRSRAAPAQELAWGVCFLYSQGESADDLIETLIEAESNPRDLLVVSDDHRVRRAARHGHCQDIGCLDYYERFCQERPALEQTSGEPPPEDGKPDGLSAEELEHWLEVFGPDRDDGTTGRGNR